MITPKDKKLYWDGNKNYSIRIYYYINKGLELVNNFKYLGAFIFALYYTLKLTNPLFLGLLFVIAIPVLFILGYLQIWHIAKVFDWLNIELGTHWNRYTYTLSERQIQLLEQILNEVKTTSQQQRETANSKREDKVSSRILG